MADVVAHVRALKTNAGGDAVRALLRRLDAVGQRRHAQHAPAAAVQHTVLQRRASMEHDCPLLFGRQAMDRIARSDLLGVTVRSHDYAQGRTPVPLQIQLRVQPASFAGGVVAMEFINRMFYSQLEPVDGNYDEGPFRKSPAAFGPWKKLPFASLGQIGTDVYTSSPLPPNHQLFSTPLSSIKRRV